MLGGVQLFDLVHQSILRGVTAQLYVGPVCPVLEFGNLSFSVLLLPFQFILGTLKLVDPLPKGVLCGLLLGVEVVGCLLQGVVDLLPQAVGRFHLSLGSFFVVSAEVLPLLGGCAPFWNSKGVWFVADLCRPV